MILSTTDGEMQMSSNLSLRNILLLNNFDDFLLQLLSKWRSFNHVYCQMQAFIEPLWKWFQPFFFSSRSKFGTLSFCRNHKYETKSALEIKASALIADYWLLPSCTRILEIYISFVCGENDVLMLYQCMADRVWHWVLDLILDLTFASHCSLPHPAIKHRSWRPPFPKNE